MGRPHPQGASWTAARGKTAELLRRVHLPAGVCFTERRLLEPAENRTRVAPEPRPRAEQPSISAAVAQTL